MVGSLRRLWRGQVPLGRAFWEYAVLYGALFNLLTTSAAAAVIVASGPVLLAVAVFLVPVPYNIASAVGVWRSAERYQGPPEHARLARVAVLVWAAILVLV